MDPLESGGCAMLGLSTLCPSHLCFNGHVFFHQKFPTYLLSAPPTRRWWRRGAPNRVAHGHHKSLIPGWVFTPTPYLFRFIIDLGRFSNLLVFRPRLWVPPDGSILGPQNQDSTLRWALANSPNSRVPPVPYRETPLPTTEHLCRTSRLFHFTLPWQQGTGLISQG